MPGVVLVELCAGSAAVSLRWLASRAAPPIGYQGGKRAYASPILAALGLQPGGGARHGRVILVEPGPWSEAWASWRTKAGRVETCDWLRAWASEDPRELWDRLKSAPVPTDIAERVATWAVLQCWSFGKKPVVTRGDGAWRHHGFANACAYRREIALERRAAGEDYEIGKSLRLQHVIAGIEALPDLSCVHVLTCDAVEVDPVPGALVVIDPPYQGTTCSYAFDLSRSDVIGLAERWRLSGATVAVCEAEPIQFPGGWHHHELPAPVGRGRTFSRQQREWLTISAPVGGQLRLPLCTDSDGEAA